MTVPVVRHRRPPARLELQVGASQEGLPLVEFAATLGAVDRALVQAAIERGGAFVGGRRVRDPARPVHAGERVQLTFTEKGTAPTDPPPLGEERILHLDSSVLVVDKPAGVLAQEGRAGGPSLLDLCEALLTARGEKQPRLFLVHRLDQGTTGVTVFARRGFAQAAMLEEFRAGRVTKEYRCLVAGAPAQDETVVERALGPDPLVPGRRCIDPRGEPAQTSFRVTERFGPVAAAVTAQPKTGRTHQIRVHLQSLGHPLLGDARYGGPRSLTRPDGVRLEATRPLLHAFALEMRHPNGGRLAVRAPEPTDLLEAARILRG